MWGVSSSVDSLVRTAGAVTMATGIVSSAVSIDGQQALSTVIFGFAAGAWATLLVAIVVGLAIARSVVDEARRTPIALTWVAATAVIGTRASIFGWQRTAQALLALSIVVWLALVPAVAPGLRRNRSGTCFLLAVSTEAIAVLSARLAPALGLRWLGFAAAGWFALGLAGYAYVLVRFDRREVVAGRGDHWIAGGAIAIATLAGARCSQAVDSIGRGIGSGLFHPLVFVLWVAGGIWLVALVAAEVVARRSFFNTWRWATVFPMGMYAVSSFAVAEVDGVSTARAFARVWTWIAVAAWLVVAAGTARSAHRAH